MTPCKYRVSLLVELCILVGPASAQSYRLTDLGNLGGGASFASGVNLAAQSVGYSAYDSNGDTHAFFYSGGVMQNLGTLGGTVSYGYGINSLGQVVGTSNLSGDTGADAFFYSGGTMTDLGTFGGTYSDAFGINDSGQIVGDAAFSGDGTQHAFLYSGGSMMDLGTLGGNSSTGLGINASGQVVGNSDTATAGVNHAFLYSLGVMSDLGTLGGDNSSASAINAAGQIAGVSQLVGDASEHAFLRTNGTMIDLGTFGGDFSEAEAVNDLGQVVGSAALTGDVANDAFLYSQGTLHDLNSLVDSSGSSYAITEAFGINDAGYIVADATYSDGTLHAVLLTPYTFTDLPTGYSLYRGVYSSGSLSSLFSIDGSYLLVLAGPTLSSLEPQASIIVNGTSTVQTPSALSLALTAHTNTTGLTQTIELWDFQASAWVLAGSQAASTGNSTQTVHGSSPARFVQSGTSAIKARVSWKQTGPTLLYQWAVRADQVLWTVAP